MVGWHHQLNGHEFEQIPGVDDGQGSLTCCSPRDHKESDTTEWGNWTELSTVLQYCTLHPPQADVSTITGIISRTLKQRSRQCWTVLLLLYSLFHWKSSEDLPRVVSITARMPTIKQSLLWSYVGSYVTVPNHGLMTMIFTGAIPFSTLMQLHALQHRRLLSSICWFIHVATPTNPTLGWNNGVLSKPKKKKWFLGINSLLS